MFVMAFWAAAQLQPQRDQLALHCLKLFGFETYAIVAHSASSAAAAACGMTIRITLVIDALHLAGAERWILEQLGKPSRCIQFQWVSGLPPKPSSNTSTTPTSFTSPTTAGTNPLDVRMSRSKDIEFNRKQQDP
jgi:hypothetical protein